MLTFTRLGQYGRLGNQLYQYAALKACCLRHGFECKIPNLENVSWHGQQCLLNNFNIEAGHLTQEDYHSLTTSIRPTEEVGGEYLSVLEQVKDNSDLFGFFQNTKYFEDFREQIIKELTPKQHLLEKEQKMLLKLRTGGKKLVSLHLRRGDMIDGTNPTYNKYYGNGPFDTSCIVGDYITKALNLFNSDQYTILVFSGGSRSGNDTEDIKWAKNTFTEQRFVVSETNDPIRDYILISQCDHNILGHASSFGWWAAYINQTPNKIVVAPLNYRMDEHLNDVDIKRQEGFFPSSWVTL